MTNKELEERILKIEEKVDKLLGVALNGYTLATAISNIKVGDSFIYNGYNYTKLNENNLCIIDDYDKNFMQCAFDPIDNDYLQSLVRLYINSDRFINKLNIDLCDISFVNGDYLTLLSKEEYEEYKPLIKNYECDWWLRSGYYNYSDYACLVYNTGSLTYYYVRSHYGVRPALKLKPEIVVELKKEEE